MDAGWSKSRISRLGKALISASPPPAESLSELHELLMVYDAALDVAVARIREHTHVQTTSRLKNTGTILEKLRRSGGGSLGNVQDLAGIRIVLDCDLTEQIRFARRIEKLFEGEARPPKIADKRLEGIRGYRAVHVIATVEGRPVEIQIRTRLQHQWANLFEKFADIVGRGIRYGEPPDEWTVLLEIEVKRHALAILADPSASRDRRESAAQVDRSESSLDEMIRNFMALSDEIQVCEAVATVYSDPEMLGEAGQLNELPSLEDLEQRREDVLEIARVLEKALSWIAALRTRYEPRLEAVKSEAGESAELDREWLRAELEKRVLGADSSSPGDDADPGDGEDGDR